MSLSEYVVRALAELHDLELHDDRGEQPGQLLLSA